MANHVCTTCKHLGTWVLEEPCNSCTSNCNWVQNDKMCTTCRHQAVIFDAEPCFSCVRSSNWIDAEEPVIENNCINCLYGDLDDDQEPCDECVGYAKFEKRATINKQPKQEEITMNTTIQTYKSKRTLINEMVRDRARAVAQLFPKIYENEEDMYGNIVRQLYNDLYYTYEVATGIDLKMSASDKGVDNTLAYIDSIGLTEKIYSLAMALYGGTNNGKEN